MPFSCHFPWYRPTMENLFCILDNQLDGCTLPLHVVLAQWILLVSSFRTRILQLYFPSGNKYFHKFWFEILKNDAHDGEWIKYPKTEHPKFSHKVTSACLVAKLHSKNNIRAQGIFHPVEMYWVTNSDGSLHTHLDVSWVSCYHALTMAESLNKGIFPEIIPTGPNVCK